MNDVKDVGEKILAAIETYYRLFDTLNLLACECHSNNCEANDESGGEKVNSHD